MKHCIEMDTQDVIELESVLRVSESDWKNSFRGIQLNPLARNILMARKVLGFKNDN